MICELTSIDDQVAALEAERRANAILCLTGQRETFNNMLVEMQTAAEDPAVSELAAFSLITSQISMLENLVDLYDQRIALLSTSEEAAG